ncbi:MAG: diguanylate cyclase [Actinomycetales bacterium]|nr:diguanylate cyclase [Actinomycetales bacterium]
MWFALTSMLAGTALALNLVMARRIRDATHDPLTGLLNRNGLDAYLELQGPPGRATLPRTLVSLDLDGFKAINDAHGHLAGDAVLRSMADCLRDVLRPDDVAVRMGGDEFLLVLPQTNTEGARALVERLRLQSPSPFSAGIAPWDRDAFDPVLRRADEAMYADKAQRSRLN